MEMRDFLSNQMSSLKKVESIRKNQERDHEKDPKYDKSSP